MTLHIELSPELERRVTEEAARRGQRPADFARAVLEEKLGASSRRERSQRIAALLEQWAAEDAARGEDAGPAPTIPPLSLRGMDVA